MYVCLAAQYFWNRMYLDIKKYVASCEEYQLKLKACLEEALYPIKASQLFTDLIINVMYLLNAKGYTRLVICRDKFSG